MEGESVPWAPFAERYSGPAHKQGYGWDNAHLAQGAIVHSMEGSMAAALAVLDGPRQASWHFSVAKDGRILQHYPSEAIAWHAGGYEANRRYWGIETEGRAGERLTDAQVDAVGRILAWLWRTHGLTEFTRHKTLWEHREMTRLGSPPTACPSDRVPWDEVISAARRYYGMFDEILRRLSAIEARVAALEARLGAGTAPQPGQGAILHTVGPEGERGLWGVWEARGRPMPWEEWWDKTCDLNGWPRRTSPVIRQGMVIKVPA